MNPLAFLAQAINAQHHWKLRLLHRWPQIAGPLAAHAQIKKIEDDTVWIATSHPAWAQEIRTMIPQLINRLNAACGQVRINKVIVGAGTGHLRPNRPDSGKTVPGRAKIVSTSAAGNAAPFTHDEHAALNAITHKKLRASLAEFYLQCKRRVSTCRPIPDGGGNGDEARHSGSADGDIVKFSRSRTRSKKN